MAMKSSNLLLALLALCTFTLLVHAETDAQFLVTDLDPKKTYLPGISVENKCRACTCLYETTEINVRLVVRSRVPPNWVLLGHGEKQAVVRNAWALTCADAKAGKVACAFDHKEKESALQTMCDAIQRYKPAMDIVDASIAGENNPGGQQGRDKKRAVCAEIIGSGVCSGTGAQEL